MTNGNDLAYPIIEENAMSGPFIHTGLTKREYFAAMNFQGLLASWGSHDVTDYDDLAMDSVKAAEALIKALNESKHIPHQ